MPFEVAEPCSDSRRLLDENFAGRFYHSMLLSVRGLRWEFWFSETGCDSKRLVCCGGMASRDLVYPQRGCRISRKTQVGLGIDRLQLVGEIGRA